MTGRGGEVEYPCEIEQLVPGVVPVGAGTAVTRGQRQHVTPSDRKPGLAEATSSRGT